MWLDSDDHFDYLCTLNKKNATKYALYCGDKYRYAQTIASERPEEASELANDPIKYIEGH